MRRIRAYCTCGGKLDANSSPPGGAAFAHECFRVIHSGEGHASCDAATARRARRRGLSDADSSIDGIYTSGMDAFRARLRETFPTEGVDLTCPHCRQGEIALSDDRVIWMHDCGAYGYYDDGADIFPDAVFRVRQGADQ